MSARAREPAEEDGPRTEALEPALGALEIRGIEMEPAAVTLEQRAAATPSDLPADQKAEKVAQCARDGQHRVGLEAGRRMPAEQHRLPARDRPCGQRPGVEHDQLPPTGTIASSAISTKTA
jgi:hypothetical protein